MENYIVYERNTPDDFTSFNDVFKALAYLYEMLKLSTDGGFMNPTTKQEIDSKNDGICALELGDGRIFHVKKV